jgi:hypothetical protein
MNKLILVALFTTLFAHLKSQNNNRSLFPLYGITPTVTTISEAIRLGAIKDNDYSVVDKEDISFIDINNDGIIDGIVFNNSDNMPKLWSDVFGFSWSLSYNEWLNLLKSLNFNIKVLNEPTIKIFDGQYRLSALISATSSTKKTEMNLVFDYGNYKNEGYSTTSANSLYKIVINCYGIETGIYGKQGTLANEGKNKDVGTELLNFINLQAQELKNKRESTDNSKYTIDNSSVFKRDTVKQIVYVNAKPDTVKQIVYVNSNTNAAEVYRFEKAADVDKKIPQSNVVNSNRFALIIGNEDYSSHQIDLKAESNVEFARNDASAFKEYCINTMGVPEKNITFLLDATLGQINQGISKLNLLSKALNGKAQLIFYYAGHGLPDEVTKEPYLIPVDVNGSNVTSGIKLQELYNKITEFPSERVTVFMDACFTGGGRNSGLLAARSVKIKPKEETMKGNLVVFSSSSGEQSSLSYAENKHGMFTYFLLKKLQETEGILTYSELSKYLKEKITVESLIINNKEQNPQVKTGNVDAGIWSGWKF